MKSTNVLYISYDGLMEPLGYSQVFQYLRELSGPNFTITLITYEKKSDWEDTERRRAIVAHVRAAGIKWIPLRYHKRPTVPATAFDILVGFLVSSWVVFWRGVRIVHVRSYVAAVIGIPLKKVFGCKFIFDMRGFWADERVDAGLWKKTSLLYRTAKRFERLFLSNADVVVSLTNAAVEIMKAFSWIKTRPPRFEVIPTCANLKAFTSVAQATPKNFVLGYVGTAAGWYEFKPVAECFKFIRDSLPDATLLILNRGDQALIRDHLHQQGIPDSAVEMKSVDHARVPREMSRMSATAFFIKPTFSKKASAPTKLGEFLGCGVPCLSNEGVGDMAQILSTEKVGVVVTDYKNAAELESGVKQLLALSREPDLRSRCSTAARKHFSLEEGARSYKRIYESLR